MPQRVRGTQSYIFLFYPFGNEEEPYYYGFLVPIHPYAGLMLEDEIPFLHVLDFKVCVVRFLL